MTKMEEKKKQARWRKSIFETHVIKKEHLELKEEEKGSGGGCHQQRQLGFLSLGDSPLRLFFAAPPQLSWATRPDWEAPRRTDSRRQNLSLRPSDFVTVPASFFHLLPQQGLPLVAIGRTVISCLS